MHGIVSLLDKDHYKLVEDIWAGLENSLGLRGVYVTPFPHFSYHVADHYDVDLLESVLQDFAAETPSFEVLTTGLGIFTAGLSPVVYVNVARSPQVSRLNRRLWPLLAEVSTGIVQYYHPEQWVPHITLGHGDVTSENLADTIQILSRWDFTWQIPIDNVALLYSQGNGQQDVIRYRFPLSGTP
ncbi:MAG TPA: 2'-5' RNA ligase family protein [Candidatus Sulfomarinibacteraceae bacterium]|nr:2'-5' RNA ligase family protein [Candidatus Sulfomarinibacteraceae bacterium]